MKINLAQMARQAGIRRKSVTLRTITPTQAQARDLYAIYRRTVNAWGAGAKTRLLPEYERTISDLQMDATIDLQAIIIAISEYAATVEISLLQSWANSMVRWHTQRIVSNIKYATNVDLTTIIGTADTATTIDDFLARNTAMIRDVSDQTRGRISDIVFRNVSLRTPVRDVAREISEATGLARKRSMRIAMDQTQKISSALDADRGIQLGFPGYQWEHSDKAHPRLEHVARDKKYFAFGSEVDREDPPGFAPFCGCKRRMVLEIPA